MRIWLVVTTLLSVLLLPQTAHARNYNQVVCDDEPNPDACRAIQKWYRDAKTNDGSGCCGLGDAYWTDQIDKVTEKGVYVTITDGRACKKYLESEEGDYYPDQSNGACIQKRDMDQKQLWVPNDKLDHYIVTDADGTKHRQGNPTGHSVVFINTNDNAIIYDPAGKVFPSVYCAFLDLPG